MRPTSVLSQIILIIAILCSVGLLLHGNSEVSSPLQHIIAVQNTSLETSPDNLPKTSQITAHPVAQANQDEIEQDLQQQLNSAVSSDEVTLSNLTHNIEPMNTDYEEKGDEVEAEEKMEESGNVGSSLFLLFVLFVLLAGVLVVLLVGEFSVYFSRWYERQERKIRPPTDTERFEMELRNATHWKRPEDRTVLDLPRW